MKPLSGIFTLLVSAALGAAIGFAVRAARLKEAPNPVATPGTEVSSVLRLESTNTQSTMISGSPFISRLEHDLAMSTGVTRWLYWMEAIEKAPIEEMPRLARLAAPDPAALRLVAARWTELNPRNFFDFLIATTEHDGAALYNLDYRFLWDWCERDPRAVVAALNEAAPFGRRDQWRRTVAGKISEADPEFGFQLMSEWHIGDFWPSMTGVAKWAAADPRHAANFILGHPAGYASEKALETIGREWARTDPEAAVEFARNRRDEPMAKLAAEALKAWAGRNLPEAAAWLAQTDPATRARFSAPVVEEWAKQDAAGALVWCEANLSGTSLGEAVQGVLTGAAEKDIAAAGRLVSAMQPSSARSAGAVAVATKWFPDLSWQKEPPAEALAWLEHLDNQSISRVVEHLSGIWAQNDAAGLASFVSRVQPSDLRPGVYGQIASNLARNQPLEAVQWANTIPEAERLHAGRAAFLQWQSSQPESALAWVAQLPDKDPRRTEFIKWALIILGSDARGPDRVAAWPSEARVMARRVIDQTGLPAESRKRLLAAAGPN